MGMEVIIGKIGEESAHRLLNGESVNGREHGYVDIIAYKELGEKERRDLKAKIVQLYLQNYEKEDADTFSRKFAGKKWRSVDKSIIYNIDVAVIRHVIGNLEKNLNKLYSQASGEKELTIPREDKREVYQSAYETVRKIHSYAPQDEKERKEFIYDGVRQEFGRFFVREEKSRERNNYFAKAKSVLGGLKNIFSFGRREIVAAKV